MRGYTVIEVIKISLDDILLELHLNLQLLDEKKSVRLMITEDGESILVEVHDFWASVSEYNLEMYTVEVIQSSDSPDELSRLIGCPIKEVLYGFVKSAIFESKTAYYVKIVTAGDCLLFFNNGDEGAYSFDKIDAILAHDIYGVTWAADLYGGRIG